MSINIGSHLISKLGSANSKIPLAVKDIFNCSGYTYFSYGAGGELEGKDRLLDEVGTGAIWLFGIPAYKKLIDKTVYKLAKISPEVDVRVIKNNNILQEAIKNAPTKEILREIEQSALKSGLTKKLAFLKFGAALGLTMLSYLGLTKLKQNMTKKNIEKEYIKTHSKSKVTDTGYIYKPTEIYKDIESKTNLKKVPSFGANALINIAEGFMLNPVKNMMILDGCISGQRLANSRTKGEFREYAIKEGSFLFFVYGAGKLIEKGINWAAEKLLKAPIDLDAKFLVSDTAGNLLRNKGMQEEVKAFRELLKGCAEDKIYSFILNNQNNTVVKAAKESGIISVIKDKAGEIRIDTRKYIDTKEMSKLVKDLSKFIEKSSKKDITKYINKIKGLKVTSTILNVGICCLVLGYMVPKYIYENRKKHQNGNGDFHVKTEYEKELAKKINKGV